MLNNYSRSLESLLITVILGFYFTIIQLLEYLEASFSISDSVFGRTFFVATGFHGLHVIIGSLFLIGYCYFVFFDPDLLGHPDNYVPANPMVTPPEIMPEFYFLPFYAIIRAIPHKAFGIVVMVFMLLSLTNLLPSIGFRSQLSLPMSNNSVRWWTGSGSPSAITPLSRALLFVFLLDVILASKLCLMVNHFESMYWLLLITVLGMSASELGRSNS
jgi:quinol-cytochrome oxidoreductase complex cytochrome b subunit